jgi:hypothetical protein
MQMMERRMLSMRHSPRLIFKECPRHDITILVGDMNPQVGRDSICEPNIGRYGPHDDTNDNGSHLVDFALAHNLLIGGILFVHKKIHKGTWKTPQIIY